MSVFILFSERLGELGGVDYFRDMGFEIDLSERNRCQRIIEDGIEYKIIVAKSRTIPPMIEKIENNIPVVGLTGLDWFIEYNLGGNGNNLRIIETLPFGKAKVVAFKDMDKELLPPYEAVTPYPNITKYWLKKEGYKEFSLTETPGETEGLVKSGIFNLGVDNTQTGETLEKTGLETVSYTHLTLPTKA